MAKAQMITSVHEVEVVGYVLVATEVAPAVEEEKVDSLTGVKPEKG